MANKNLSQALAWLKSEIGEAKQFADKNSAAISKPWVTQTINNMVRCADDVQRALTAHETEAKRRLELKLATGRAQATLKPGDRVSRTMCAGLKGTFVFTHWEGDWACGKTVSDCHATHIYRVNLRDVNFLTNNRG